MAIVYKITRIDGLEYIGITVNLKKRLRDHSKSKRFEQGIKEYVILYEGDYSACESLEEKFIVEYDTYHNGLNVTKSGKGNHNYADKFNTLGLKPTEETKRKISESNKKAKLNKIAWNKGKTGYHIHSIEARASMSQKLKGSKNGRAVLSEEIVRTIVKEFETRPHLDCAGIVQKNGVEMSYEWAFSKNYSSKYGIVPATMMRLLRKKIWKHVWQEFDTQNKN